ncbi:hypothetical protein ACJRO7_004272 [Eucalyptus globulus]|uniref:Secreted protein n=1 Tax=Eucalyptus globulus TaxID=34317 RepID=A0ABD3J221_EUCGL
MAVPATVLLGTTWSWSIWSAHRMLAGETCPSSRTGTANARGQPAACGRSYERGKPYAPCVPAPNCKHPCDPHNRACN